MDCASQGMACLPDYGCAIPCTTDRECPTGDYCDGTACLEDLPDGDICNFDSGPPCAPGLLCQPVSLASLYEAGLLLRPLKAGGLCRRRCGRGRWHRGRRDRGIEVNAADATTTDGALVDAAAGGGVMFGMCQRGAPTQEAYSLHSARRLRRRPGRVLQRHRCPRNPHAARPDAGRAARARPRRWGRRTPFVQEGSSGRDGRWTTVFARRVRRLPAHRVEGLASTHRVGRPGRWPDPAPVGDHVTLDVAPGWSTSRFAWGSPCWGSEPRRSPEASSPGSSLASRRAVALKPRESRAPNYTPGTVLVVVGAGTGCVRQHDPAVPRLGDETSGRGTSSRPRALPPSTDVSTSNAHGRPLCLENLMSISARGTNASSRDTRAAVGTSLLTSGARALVASDPVGRATDASTLWRSWSASHGPVGDRCEGVTREACPDQSAALRWSLTRGSAPLPGMRMVSIWFALAGCRRISRSSPATRHHRCDRDERERPAPSLPPQLETPACDVRPDDRTWQATPREPHTRLWSPSARTLPSQATSAGGRRAALDALMGLAQKTVRRAVLRRLALLAAGLVRVAGGASFPRPARLAVGPREERRTRRCCRRVADHGHRDAWRHQSSRMPRRMGRTSRASPLQQRAQPVHACCSLEPTCVRRRRRLRRRTPLRAVVRAPGAHVAPVQHAKNTSCSRHTRGPVGCNVRRDRGQRSGC